MGKAACKARLTAKPTAKPKAKAEAKPKEDSPDWPGVITLICRMGVCIFSAVTYHVSELLSGRNVTLGPHDPTAKHRDEATFEAFDDGGDDGDSPMDEGKTGATLMMDGLTLSPLKKNDMHDFPGDAE